MPIRAKYLMCATGQHNSKLEFFMNNFKSTLLCTATIGVLAGCQYHDQERMSLSDLTVQDPKLQACIDFAVDIEPENAGAKYADEIKVLKCNDVVSLNGIHRMPNLEFLRFNSGAHRITEEEHAKLEHERNLFHETARGKSRQPEAYHPDHGDGYMLEDLTPLTGLKHLTTLQLEDQELMDLSVLTEVESLEHFMYYRSYDFEDISFIAGMPQLKSIQFFENNITDITPLLQAEQLEFIRFVDNKISTDISLEHMTNLKRADFTGAFDINVPITDLVRSIAAHDGLEDLDMSYSNLGGFANLTGKNLHRFRFDHNPVGYLSFLAESNVKQIYMIGASLENIDEISELKDLEIIDFTRNNITHLSSYAIDNFATNSPNMEEITLRCTWIPEDEIELLREAMPNTKVNYSHSSSCHHW
ncbi:leucine-rich repeat domain-containing protein [Vibrio sp. WXL103]|uniref:leucine-rich repeat domain-containing protein n=1 Tax=unclassified Vibrio TaxID=2614977 RepID=UPI003EC85597